MRRCFLLAPLFLFACSATKDGSGGGTLTGDDTGGGFSFDTGTTGGDGGFNLDGTTPDALPPTDTCPEALKLVYVVTQGNELYSFAPATLSFVKIGDLSCPSGGFANPFSMAVARNGIAWVLYDDGNIFHVSVKDASCTKTSYVPGQKGYTTFGMAFVSNSPGSTDETLYVAGYEGQGIAKIDTATLALTEVGTFGGARPGSGELTGTGEAKMFGFFSQTPATVAEIDPKTSNILGTKPSAVTVGSGWAFAHWGGSFWLFTAPSGTSQVDQFDYTTGTDKTVRKGLGYVIVGAGVSTCAPTKPPK